MRIISLILSLFIVNLPAADRDTIAQISPEMTKALNKGLKYLASQQARWLMVGSVWQECRRNFFVPHGLHGSGALAG